MLARRFSKSDICYLILPLTTFAGSNLQQVLPAWSDEAVDINGLAISTTWQGLGPFKIGTREAIWGADPLEAFGGFRQLDYDRHATYPSSLLPNASLSWSNFEGRLSQTTDSVILEWMISHPEVDWESMQKVYGWSAFQYQTWIRGEIHNKFSTNQCVSLFPNNILEYYINDEFVFGGDFYGFNRAPMTVRLKPGKNILNIRLFRDVRPCGGLYPPDLEASLKIEPCLADVRLVENSLVAPETVDGRLSSAYIGVTIQNLKSEAINIHQCQDEDRSDVRLVSKLPVSIAAGQSIPLALQVMRNDYDPFAQAEPAFVKLCYREQKAKKHSTTQHVDFIVLFKDIKPLEPRKITFLHPNDVVSYAILKPPAITNTSTETIPLMVSLHGAGLEADSDFVRNALNEIQDLPGVSLCPTGLSQWSSDDWHSAGMIDVLAAVDAAKEWSKSSAWDGPQIDIDRFLVTGHSNGGQGTWYLASHLPDRVLAAAPASGYTSIENYVPFNLWTIADQSRILDMARKNFRNEILIENMANMPILQQHGELDDNVPPYHSRLMSSLRAQAHLDSAYVEVTGKLHYWDGAMATKSLRDFYRQHLTDNSKSIVVPTDFQLTAPNSHDMHSRFGMVIDQLLSPDQVGRVDVVTDHHSGIWSIRTSNVHRFHLDPAMLTDQMPKKVCLDDEPESRPVGNRTFVLTSQGKWIAEEAEWKTLSTRSGRQRGAMEAILRTHGPFQIVDYTDKNDNIAVQISLNLLQYFGAASNLSKRADYKNALSCSGNVITLALGENVPESKLSKFPITFTSKGIVLSRTHHADRRFQYSPGLGLAMLRPLNNERLELLVWGQDVAGLQQAMRLVPTLTGAGQPDFVILGKEARWEGHGGAFALGFFDHSWSISGASYIW